MKIFMLVLFVSTSAFASMKNNPMRRMKSAEFIVAETIIDKNCDTKAKYAEVIGAAGNSYQYICNSDVEIVVFDGMNGSNITFREKKSNEQIISISHPHEVAKIKTKLREVTGQTQKASAEAKAKEEFKQQTIKKWTK